MMPIFASGRFDYSNQVNNVLAVPSVFRSALDARATRINWEMKLTASRAIASLARQLPEFGPQCILPHTLDPHALPSRRIRPRRCCRQERRCTTAAAGCGRVREGRYQPRARVRRTSTLGLHQSGRLGADVSCITGEMAGAEVNDAAGLPSTDYPRCLSGI
jgi:hypothetical protein